MWIVHTLRGHSQLSVQVSSNYYIFYFLHMYMLDKIYDMENKWILQIKILRAHREKMGNGKDGIEVQVESYVCVIA